MFKYMNRDELYVHRVLGHRRNTFQINHVSDEWQMATMKVPEGKSMIIFSVYISDYKAKPGTLVAAIDDITIQAGECHKLVGMLKQSLINTDTHVPLLDYSCSIKFLGNKITENEVLKFSKL